MDRQSLFDPHSTLRHLVVQHVHALKGTCFGRVARSFFLHSGEMLPQVDCFFHNREAAEAFLASRGLIVRGVGGYGLPHHLRFTIGLEEHNRAVVDALSDFMAS